MMACGVSQSSDLLPLEGAKDGVWSYFDFPAKDGKFMEPDKKRTSIHCKLCTKVLKCIGDNRAAALLSQSHMTNYFHMAKNTAFNIS